MNEYRSKWDLPHKDANDYKRSKIRKDLKKEIEEYEKERKDYYEVWGDYYDDLGEYEKE